MATQSPRNLPFLHPVQQPASRGLAERAAIQDARLRYFYNLALEITRDIEFSRAITAVAAREGGLYGAIGDNGRSHGPLQFHLYGQLPNFAKKLNAPLPVAGETARSPENWDKVIKFAWEGYLGDAYREGKARGLTGPDLATYISQYGQRSVNPGLSGKKYTELFMPAALAENPVTSDQSIAPLPFLHPVRGAPVMPSEPPALPAPRPSTTQALATDLAVQPRPFAPPTQPGAPARPTPVGEVLKALRAPLPEPALQWGPVKEYLKRLLLALSIPQATVETVLTGGRRFEELGVYQSVRDRLATALVSMSEEDIRRGRRPTHVPPQAARKTPLTREEAEDIADTVLNLGLRTATDPLVYGAFWKFVGRIPALLRISRSAPPVQPPPSLAPAAEAAPVSRAEQLLAERQKAFLEAHPPFEAPIAVTPRTVTPGGRVIEPVAVVPVGGETRVPTAKFPLSRTPSGRFAPRMVGTEYRPAEQGRIPPPAPYADAQPVYNEAKEIVGWRLPNSEVIHPDPLQQVYYPHDVPVSIWVEPIQPKALPAPRPYIRVSGSVVDIVYPRTPRQIEQAAVQEIIHTTPTLATSISDQIDLIREASLGQATTASASVSAYGKFLERHVDPRVAGRFSRVAAYLDRLGEPGRAIRLAMEGVYKTAVQTLGEEEAKLLARLGEKRLPRFTKAELLNMADVMWEGKAPLNARVKAAVEAMRESYENARNIILQNNIPGYVRREDLQKFALQYGIDSTKAYPAKYVKLIGPDGKVVQVPRLFRLPAEEWVKLFQAGYHHRAFNWNKLRADYANPAKRNEILDHLIHLGQAKSRAEADALLSNALGRWTEYVEHVIPTIERPLAHFQFPRVMPQLPKEYYLHPLDAWRKYFLDLGTILGYNRHLGADGEVIRSAYHALVSVDNPALDKTLLEDILAWFFGRKNDYTPYSPLFSSVTAGTVLLKMGLSTINQTGQFTHIYAMAGARNLVKAFREVSSKQGFGYVDAVRAGAILSPTNVLKEMNAASAISEGYLYLNRFLPLDQFLRAVGFQAGRYTFDDIMAAYASGKPGHLAKWFTQVYKESTGIDLAQEAFRLSPAIKRALATADTKTLESTLSQVAGRLREDFGYWMANETQFRGTLLDKPLMTQHPLGKFVLAIRGFAFRQAAFVSRYMFGEAYKWATTGGKEGSIVPLVRFLAMGVPMGTAILTARTLLASLFVTAVSLGMGARSIRSWDDFKHVVEERLDHGRDAASNTALLLWDALNAVGGWGVITDAARSVWGSPIPFRAHAIMSQIVGIPATTAVEFLAQLGAPAYFLLDWATSPSEERAGKNFTEQFLKELRRGAGAVPGLVAGLGPLLTEQLRLRTPESIRLRYIRLIKRNLMQGDWESARYWSRKMLEATGDVPSPEDLERWSRGVDR